MNEWIEWLEFGNKKKIPKSFKFSQLVKHFHTNHFQSKNIYFDKIFFTISNESGLI